MALKPGSEPELEGEPEEYAEHHPAEHPSMWGWHGDWGRWSRVAGWVVIGILLVMITATHYNDSGTMWLIIFAAGIFVALLWDIRRRRSAWRK